MENINIKQLTELTDFKQVNTGGGGAALWSTCLNNQGFYLLITEAAGYHIPQDNDEIAIGYYNGFNTQLDLLYTDNQVEAQQFIEAKIIAAKRI